MAIDESTLWVKVGDDMHRFTAETPQLSGTYEGSEIIEINGEPATRHRVTNEDGMTSTIFFGTTLLTRALQQISPGTVIRITFDGWSEKTFAGGNNMKLFTVERAISG